MPEWQAVMRTVNLLRRNGGPTMLARTGIMRHQAIADLGCPRIDSRRGTLRDRSLCKLDDRSFADGMPRFCIDKAGASNSCFGG
jgi:hypothetical protein